MIEGSTARWLQEIGVSQREWRNNDLEVGYGYMEGM